MFFSSYAASVTVLVRGEGLVLTMSQYLITQLNQRQNITVESHTEVVSIDGENCLESIHTTTNRALARKRKADALFVMIGAIARTDWLPADLQRDTKGFVLTGRDLLDWRKAQFTISARNQHARNILRGRCPPRLNQAGVERCRQG